MSRHPESPCSTCPYRRDAPIGHWAPEEFRDLLASERTKLGAVYACHGHVKIDPRERGMCAGWLLDQKRRGIPSIMLRLALIRDPEAGPAIEAVNDGGHDLYPSLAAMCRANGVLRRSRPASAMVLGVGRARPKAPVRR